MACRFRFVAAITRTFTVRGRRSELIDLALLKKPKQFRLHFDREFSDFVKEESAPVRHFDSAGFGGLGRR